MRPIRMTTTLSTAALFIPMMALVLDLVILLAAGPLMGVPTILDFGYFKQTGGTPLGSHHLLR